MYLNAKTLCSPDVTMWPVNSRLKKEVTAKDCEDKLPEEFRVTARLRDQQPNDIGTNLLIQLDTYYEIKSKHVKYISIYISQNIISN